MLCLFSSAYKGFSVAVFVVWRGLYALLVSSSQFEVEVYVKCVVRDCCRAEREVSLLCRQSLEALEHGFCHHEVRFCWLQL